MNKKLLIISIAAILAAPSAFAARTIGPATDGTDADDKQTVNIIVPEVALLDVVTVGTLELTMPAPTGAGGGFLNTNARESDAQTLKFSANSLANSTSTDGRTITASIASVLPENWKLTITPTLGTDITASPQVLDDETTSVNIVTNIINQKAEGTFKYTFGPKEDGDMMAFSASNDAAKQVEIIYTLSTDA